MKAGIQNRPSMKAHTNFLSLRSWISEKLTFMECFIDKKANINNAMYTNMIMMNRMTEMGSSRT